MARSHRLFPRSFTIYSSSWAAPTPEYKVNSVPRPGRMEFTCTVEVFDGQEVVVRLVLR
jgi:hypothetical protein